MAGSHVSGCSLGSTLHARCLQVRWVERYRLAWDWQDASSKVLGLKEVVHDAI